jgi:hypothetical protein
MLEPLLTTSSPSGPSGVFGSGGKTGPPTARSFFPVKQFLAIVILAATARKFADITSGFNARHDRERSSRLGLGIDGVSATPEHLKRRPSVSTNTQSLRRRAFETSVQLVDVTRTDGPLPLRTSAAVGDLDATALPHPAAPAANTTAPSNKRERPATPPPAGTSWRERRETISQRYSAPHGHRRSRCSSEAQRERWLSGR